MPASQRLIVSGYTQAPHTGGPGIRQFELAFDGTVGARIAQSNGVRNPSFLTRGGGVFYAVEEQTDGTVVALDPESLDVLGRVPTGGEDPCHLIYRDGEVWVANYSSGNAAVLAASPIDAASARLFAHPGRGPVTERQGESHAHQVTATPWGTVLVADLGSDRVDEYVPDTEDGVPVRIDSAELPPGTGPRHVALKGDFLLVAGELDGYLHVLRRSPLAQDAKAEGGGHFWKWLFKTPLAASVQAIEAAEQFYPSHLELSDDATLAYAAVRGPNTVVVLDVSGLAGHTPLAPVFLREIPSGGNWPRHFALGAEKIYVANQLSDNVSVFALDAHGLPGAEAVQNIEFGSPACILLA